MSRSVAARDSGDAAARPRILQTSLDPIPTVAAGDVVRAVSVIVEARADSRIRADLRPRLVDELLPARSPVRVELFILSFSEDRHVIRVARVQELPLPEKVVALLLRGLEGRGDVPAHRHVQQEIGSIADAGGVGSITRFNNGSSHSLKNLLKMLWLLMAESQPK